MKWNDLAVYLAFIAVVTATVRPLGSYLARVFTYESTLLDPLLIPLERLIVRLVGPAAERPMKWHEYFFAFVWFGLAGAAFIFMVLKLQQMLPFYRLVGKDVLSTPMTDDLAINTAISSGTDPLILARPDGFEPPTTWFEVGSSDVRNTEQNQSLVHFELCYVFSRYGHLSL
jgi:K+-transporting ATPase A subunit